MLKAWSYEVEIRISKYAMRSGCQDLISRIKNTYNILPIKISFKKTTIIKIHVVIFAIFVSIILIC